MSHGATKPDVGAPTPKPDEISLARVFPINLLTWRLIGAKHELDGELRALTASVHGFPAPVDYLAEAARRVFAACQEELVPLEGTFFRGRDADEIGSALAYAATGLYAVTGNWGPVKDVHLAATGGRPLAICGRGFREGCGRVFPDSIRRNAHPFATWCGPCGASGMTRAYQHREAKRRSQRLPGDYQPPPSWLAYRKAPPGGRTIEEEGRIRVQVARELRDRLDDVRRLLAGSQQNASGLAD